MEIDIYSLSEELSLELENQGYKGIKSEIEELILKGCTGTEIIMSLRWRFERFLNEEKVSEDILIKINNFLEKINFVISDCTRGE